jgi:hypothetical protein
MEFWDDDSASSSTAYESTFVRNVLDDGAAYTADYYFYSR